MGWTSSFVMFIGRILLAALFLTSAYGKIMNYDGTAAYMASHHLPMVPLLLSLSIIIEVIGGLSLLFGYKTRVFAAILFLYLIPVTILMHNFWDITDAAQKQDNMIHFLKNIGIMGGLLYVAATGAGYIGCDRCSGSCSKKEIE